MEWEEINGYITCCYGGRLRLAYVLQTMQASDEIQVSFLQPHGPSRSFSFPSRRDQLIIFSSHALTSVSLTRATGRTNSLTNDETKKSSDAFLNQLNSNKCRTCTNCILHRKFNAYDM